MQFVYSFDEVKNANTEESMFILGNKGAQLAEMTAAGLPVPPGFVITTEACKYFYKNGKKWPASLEKEIKEKLAKLEEKTGKKIGDIKNPLLVSVRSGSYVSMPGMMDTVLNLGLNDTIVEGLAKVIGERPAWDSYRRFIQMFGDVVMNVAHFNFEKNLERVKGERKLDTELTVADLKKIVELHKETIKNSTGKDFPTDPWEQLRMAIDAVFNSWNNERAIKYRKINHLRDDAGTAVNIQAMVFGNRGNTSGTGVAFTRNPSTGKKEYYGEFLINAQGEDVVAGIRTPEPISAMKKILPEVYKQLIGIYDRLEKHYREMQDFEFTIEEGKLFILQTRNGKRTAQAAVKIAVDMAKEKLITKKEAVLRIKPEQLDQLLHKQIDPNAKKEEIAKGLPASPGAAVGKIVFTAERAVELTNMGEKIILVRTETSPEDIEGMHVAQGILTARGGVTSHAAVVARGMGKCCVSGSSDIEIEEEKKEMRIKATGAVFKEGDVITLDGSEGKVFKGGLPLVEPQIKGEFAELMSWADKYRKLGVRTNADTPKDSLIARNFGAEGIGLCRTEHMFFKEDRIISMREMILADTEQDRRKALNKLLPYQRKDFEEIFKVMDKLPVIIRFLDPPLHEFLPKEDKEIKLLAKTLGIKEEKIKERVNSLHEFNPMLGFRGCRLGIIYPEIYEMQARAVFEAALNVKKEGKIPVPQIEVPNVINAKEFKMIKDIIKRVAKETGAEGKIKYEIGTMIEFPRAALIADELAKEVDFMSFGTNDLTQTTLGFSRDDAGRFIGAYVEKGIFQRDPFQTLDQEGVGKLMKITVEKARSVKPKIDIGICGEHGGDPATIRFCHRIGMSNVSCSPYRVPIARLAAAQAALEAF